MLQVILKRIAAFITSLTIVVNGLTGQTPVKSPVLEPTLSTVTSQINAVSSSTPVSYTNATGDYTDGDKSTKIELKLPTNGGDLMGTISGICNGKINGRYFRENEEISGTAEGECLPKLLTENNKKLIGRSTFKGRVNLSDNLIKIDFDGNLYPNPPYTDNTLHIPYANKHTLLKIEH